MLSKNISIISLIFCIFFTTFGHYYFKIFFIKKNLNLMLIAIILFIFTPFFTYIALKNLSLSEVYMSLAMVNVLLLIVSKYFLNEEMNSDMYIGSFLIISGVVLFNI